jgi:hypothetical protein
VSPRRILVALSFDATSVVALLRGASLASRLGVELAVVHVIWERPDDGVIGPARADDAARVVVEWAASLGVDIAESAVEIRSGSPDIEILAAATVAPPLVLVVGGRAASDASPPGRVARFVAKNAPMPVLVAAPPLPSRRIVAASDLVDETYPVLRATEGLATALTTQATAVHNVDASGEALVERTEQLSRLVSALPTFRDALVTRERSPSTAIATVARMTAADFVVVGVRQGRGDTLASLLATEQRSIVAVPIDAASG